jgi:xanthine dehydrogenase accessory factor
MKELTAILSEFKKRDITRQAALATVVNVNGSSYRSAGARMLITDDGKWVGSISGGCLEGDALRKARTVMTTKIPMTVTYDSREESNQQLGISLGCNGVIDVLIEPFSEKYNPIAWFDLITQQNQPTALATIYCAEDGVGEKLWITEQVVLETTITNSLWRNQIHGELSTLFKIKKSFSQTLTMATGGSVVEVFLEWIQPTISLLIFGGGIDARPVSQLAKSLGWHVQVTDECVAHIAPIFFPNVDKLSLCQREFIDRDFAITNYTACVLMSHNYEYDRDVLKKIIDSSAPYIGILGPRKRFTKMQEELKKEGIALGSSQLERIHSPIGLDIGAEGAEEIAVSIIAEIKSKFSNRPSGFLKDKVGAIHSE